VKIACMPAYRDRAPRKGPLPGRCCWVCGKNGGWGFTNALRGAGYRMEPGEMAYAHPACMARAAKGASKKTKSTANAS
jgi:hypothetical protein